MKKDDVTNNIIQFPQFRSDGLLAKTRISKDNSSEIIRDEIKKIIDPKTNDLSNTLVTEAMLTEAKKLDQLSKYQSDFDYNIYARLEKRYEDKPIRGGIVFKSPMKLVNAHSTCQQCLYSFEIDTYGRGCIHNCVYCYAKAELTVHGYWNNPIPVPVDINQIRKTFYTVFETDKKNKWREVMARKIPLRIGSMSDSFMWTDQTYKVTQELLKILKFYKYPYVIFTRSDLAANDTYLNLYDKDLTSIQYSISSTNDDLNRKIEPGAPSAKRRLEALKKINQAGFWTTVRLNPFFPIHPDGYFSDPNFKWEGKLPTFNYSSFEMIDQIAETGTPSVLAGFARLSSFGLNQIEKAIGQDLRVLFDRTKVNKSSRDFHFTDEEVRAYYEKIKQKCVQNAIEFTTCYIGQGENHFWKDQDLWDNKKDCCNIKGKVSAFQTDSREIKFEDRLKAFGNKTIKPDSNRLHEPLN